MMMMIRWKRKKISSTLLNPATCCACANRCSAPSTSPHLLETHVCCSSWTPDSPPGNMLTTNNIILTHHLIISNICPHLKYLFASLTSTPISNIYPHLPRLPIRFKDMLRRKLIPLKFQICHEHQSDNIALSAEIQNHFKEGFHVGLFVDRGRCLGRWWSTLTLLINTPAN